MARREVTPCGPRSLFCGVQAKVTAISTETGMKSGFRIFFLIKENDFFEHNGKNAVEYQRRICILGFS